MRENKKFMISILGVIALYIVTITTTAGITRDIGKNNTNIMVEQDINKQATDVNVVEKQEEQVLPLKEIKIPEKAPKKISSFCQNFFFQVLFSFQSMLNLMEKYKRIV